MRITHSILALLFTCFAGNAAHGQTDAHQKGALKGIVWDSARALVMPAATVAVYRATDTSLVAYTLSDKHGAFHIRSLPIGIPLKMVTSFIGYKTITGNCQLSSTDISDIGRINMTVAATRLEEVVVTPPPVRMKGDTLEFQADAFKLDPNAQTEDLLRILPGVIVWADGLITVNGREVSSVLVNGKPFFGSDARVATQNIPKNIVDKVQVYRKDNGNAKKDSSTEINIKLKKGKDEGYFGKISAGYGSGKYYEFDGSLNFFNKHTQLSIAGVKNNVNKIADGMSFLLANHTFKGAGANIEYQSNFKLPGITRYSAGGLLFQHDFLDNPTNQNSNRIIAEYFINKNQPFLLKSTQTITSLNDSSYFLQRDKSNNTSTLLRQQGTIHYEKNSKGNKFTINGLFTKLELDRKSEGVSLVSSENEQLLSNNAISNHTNSSTSNFSLIASFAHTPRQIQGQHPMAIYNIDYSIIFQDDNQVSDYKSIYQAFTNPGLTRDLARLYNYRDKRQIHKLTLTIPRFVTGIFAHGFFATTDLGIKNEVEINDAKLHHEVMDKDVSATHYHINPYLTNKREEITYNIKPAVTMSRKFPFKTIREHSRNLSLDLYYGPQFFVMQSTSEKQFQQISKQYRKAVGQATVRFEQFRTGRYMNSIMFQATVKSQFPTIEQLAPLIDSANLNYIKTGNMSLKEQNTREFSLHFNHNSLRPQNNFTWYVALTGGYANNYFAHSNRIDTIGRMINSIVNADGYRYAVLNGQIRKSYKRKQNQIQFSLSPTVSLNRTPSYINDVNSYFYNFSLSYSPTISYSYKDRLSVIISNRQTYSRYSQKIENNIDLTSAIHEMELSVHFKCSKKLSVGSNAIHTTNTFNNNTRTTFTIWNGFIAYRILPGNNAELKCSALDILRQNTGLINFGHNNSVTQGKANALRQYFMLTLSWYPRHFGK